MSSRQRRVVTAVLLVIASVTWLLVNHPVEGRTLVVVTPEHGLTEADVPAVVVLVVAAALLLSARR